MVSVDAFTSGVIRECKKIPLEGERAVSIVLCYLVQHFQVLVLCVLYSQILNFAVLL